MAGSDRPEWPPRSSRPGDLGDAAGERFDFDYEVREDVPPPRRSGPRPDAGPRAPRADRADRPEGYERAERPKRPLRRDSGDKQPAGKAKQTHSRGNLLWRWRRGFFVLGLIGMAAVASGVATVAQTELPPLARLRGSSFICAAGVADGQCDASTSLVKLSEDQDRVFVPLDQIPEHVREAVISAEDRDFYDHKGIDPMGIGRALVRDLRGGRTQGGSTITQQLVKNAFLLDSSGVAERSLGRKVKEAVLAMKIEKQMSKDEILERYLNEIYFGRNAYGIQAASWAYFGKRIQDVGIQEAAYLAGLIRSPERADPLENAEEATRRRHTVLVAMAEEGYITAAERDATDAVPLNTYVIPAERYRRAVYNWPGMGGAQFGVEYVTDFVEEQLSAKLVGEFDYTQEQAAAEIQQGGFRVYTTLDPAMQQQAVESINAVLDDPATDPSAALVAIDDQGLIRAMVGGRDYAAQSVNLASGNKWGRQVGSTFKPIALATALNEGYSLQRSTVNAPGELPTEQTENCDARSFKNYSSESASTGRLNLIDATRTSSNTGYVDLMVQLTPEKVLAMADKLGMDVDPNNSRGHIPCPTTVLGSGGSSPLEMAEVYSTFANRGVHKEPTIITRIERVDEDGELDVLWTWQPDEQPVMTPTSADLVTHALRQVIDDGTGTGAAIDTAAAGKTGTTSNNRDAWFVGYVPKLTAAVWMGYANPDPTKPVLDENGVQKLDRNGQPIFHVPTMNSDDTTGIVVRGKSRGVTGGSFPADIWQEFMSQATSGMAPEDLQFVEPTPDQIRGGTPLDPNNTGEAPVTTLPPEEEDPDLTIPDISIPMTRPGSSTPSSSTPPSSTQTTVWPPVTPPGRPGSGDGTG